MKRELQDKLKKDFPLLYSHLGEPGLMSSLGCGNGWFDLLYDLSTKLEPLIEVQPVEERAYVGQVKEKFATLRFYMLGNVTEEMERHILLAEQFSSQTCERCGAGTNGEPKNVGKWTWIKSFCDYCQKVQLVKRDNIPNRLVLLVLHRLPCSKEEWKQIEQEKDKTWM